MRYTIWGPIVGLIIASFLFLLGFFGSNFNGFIIAAAVLVAIGLVGGLVADLKK